MKYLGPSTISKTDAQLDQEYQLYMEERKFRRLENTLTGVGTSTDSQAVSCEQPREWADNNVIHKSKPTL